MSENGPTSTSGPSPAEPTVAKSRLPSPVWLIPIVAVAVAASVAYQAIRERGPRVVITFESGQGLEAGKSKVKYLDIDIGTVDGIHIRDDLKHVEVHCSLDKGAKLVEGTKWWVVRPRVGQGRISGLGTIISGSYLTLEPGPEGGRAQTEFVGLEDPPLPAEDLSGLRVVLHSDRLRGLDTGAPVFFRDIRVGEVIHYTLSDDGKSVDVQAVIDEEHASRVRSNSRFWDAGGVELSVGASGLTVKTESLHSILAGGVAFDSPGSGEPAKDGQVYWLASSYADAHRTNRTHGGLRLELETGALAGVAVGDPVLYREVPVGAVVSYELSKDGSKVRIRANIQRRHARLVRSNSVFWNASGITADLGFGGLEVHAESLKSILTGGIAFATPAKPGHLVKDGSVFELHAKAKDQWRNWETRYASEKAGGGEEHRGFGRFFHHRGKSEEKAMEEDPSPEPATHDEHKHGFLRKLFKRGD